MDIKEATQLINELIDSEKYMEIYGGASNEPMNVALEIAVDSMQKQEPMKPTPYKKTSCEWCNGKEYIIDSRDYTCLGITGNKLTAWGEGEATGHINYCPNCGRKLDWTEDEA